ncbi:MAG TPA: cation diffusion facilitator family transporter [Bacteroidales bacterium]|jgi:cation diffusion facilitator family transporter|nr:cation diffusion facilitator family transporter [Bacteroidales bacterium]HNZ43812.1 cation diffusion facilitator family transporter [Bacteroidales bacterium]HOH83534.1 cation diffusion facilitator family transporter [Bacteroidales bacterium]
MSHQNASVKSILFALLANFGIAVTKTIAAIITGSGAMLAESIHSFADCGNQGLLFLGLRSSKKKPDSEHPLGYGKEIYFWSFIVALILFSMGGLFSIYEGVHKITAHQGLRSPVIALIVLTVSMALEAASLLGCLKQIKKIRKEKKLWQWVRGSRKSELIVVLGEDIAALLGLFFAMLAVILSMITGNPVYDAMGSISIGVLLVIISFLLAFKVKSLLIGQSAEDDTREEIKRFLESRPEIAMIYNIITIQLGPDIMVSVKVKMTQTSSINQMIKDINNCEKELKKHFEAIRWVFFEPDNKE